MTERDREQKKGRLRRSWSKWWGLIVIGFILLALLLVPTVLVSTGNLRLGFGEIRATVHADEFFKPEKYLWDWMELILIPAVLAAGAALFTWLTDKRRQEAEERRAQTEREIELDRSRDAAFQNYLDSMTELIKDKLRQSGPEDAKRSIARARTLTALRQLDGYRKGLLVSFLHDSGLIGGLRESGDTVKEYPTIVDLTAADLSEAQLCIASLCLANLSKTDLTDSDLSHANLIRANLSTADLTRANLRDAWLGGANLSHAYLVEACLIGADLRGADLRYAMVTHEQLLEADSFEGALLKGDEGWVPRREQPAIRPEPAPAEPVPQDAEEQTDRPDDLDAGEADNA
jgi:uncharacterized protein YjbI with pentapeptide repeats